MLQNNKTPDEQKLSAKLALIGKIRRIELNPLEIAKGLKTLIENFGLTQREVARSVGKKRSTIANYLRLLNLPEIIQKHLQSDHLSMGHAKAILSITHPIQQELFLWEIIKKNYTVRQAEEAARLVTTPLEGPRLETTTEIDEALHLKALEKRIQERLGTRVELRGKGSRGQLTLHYYDLDDLDRILEQLGVSIA